MSRARLIESCHDRLAGALRIRRSLIYLSNFVKQSASRIGRALMQPIVCGLAWAWPDCLICPYSARRSRMPRRVGRDPRGITTEIEHCFERPSWLCRSCGSPWPCPATKDYLRATMDRLERVIYMDLHLPDLLDDQPDLSVEAAFDRLVWWARGS